MYNATFRPLLITLVALSLLSCSASRKAHKKLSAFTVQSEQTEEMVNINWTKADDTGLLHWKVYYQYGKIWEHRIMDRHDRALQLPPHNGKFKLNAVAVTAFNATGEDSVRKEIDPHTLAIIPRSGWNANEARPYKQHVPKQITVHHEGGKVLADTADGGRRLKNIQTWGMGKDRNWADVPYHYLIAADGTVYEGRNALTVGETNTEYDPTGHLLICFLGNYGEQELNEHLLDILTRLIAHFCKKYNIPAETIATHRDHSTQTNCPGKNIYPYFENGYVKKRVIELLKEEKK